MNGYTDSLTLIAPCYWWPPFSELHTHPIEPNRTFISAICDGGATLEADSEDEIDHEAEEDNNKDNEKMERNESTKEQNATHHHSCGLSRLGVSVFLLATWVTEGEETEADALTAVQVYDPFRGAPVELMIDMDASVGLLGSSLLHNTNNNNNNKKNKQPNNKTLVKEKPSLAELAQSGRIRVRPTYLGDEGNNNHSNNTNDEIQCILLGSYYDAVSSLWLKTIRSLQQQRQLSRNEMSPNDTKNGKTVKMEISAENMVESVLLVGEPPETELVMKYVADRLPSQFSLRTSINKDNTTNTNTNNSSTNGGYHVGRQYYLVEHRTIDLYHLLSLDEREALAVIRAALTLPFSFPHSNHNNNSSNCAFCIIIKMCGVDILTSSSNSHTAVIVAELVSHIDSINRTTSTTNSVYTNVHVLFWCSAKDVTAIHATLRGRLGLAQLTLGRPPVACCLRFLEHLLASSLPSFKEENEKAEEKEDKYPPLNTQQLQYAAERMSATFSHAQILQQTTHPQLLQWLYGSIVPQYKLLYGKADESSAIAAAASPFSSFYSHLFGIDNCLKALEELLVWPLTHLRELQTLNIQCTKGALLCGPTGCGKTAVMTALAKRLLSLKVTYTLNVIIIDGLSLIEKEVGKTEKNIARIFQQARVHTPTVLFIDNLDALAPPRGRASNETNIVADRSLSTLLTEMDGVTGDPREVVIVVASAPSAACLDAAICRPGRLDVHIELHPPSLEDGVAVLVQRLRHFVEEVIARGIVVVEQEENNTDSNHNSNEIKESQTPPNVTLEHIYELVHVQSTKYLQQQKKNPFLKDEGVSAVTITSAYREIVLFLLSNDHEDENVKEQKPKFTLNTFYQRLLQAFDSLS